MQETDAKNLTSPQAFNLSTSPLEKWMFSLKQVKLWKMFGQFQNPSGR
jgi:hypothetical protein